MFPLNCEGPEERDRNHKDSGLLGDKLQEREAL